jgi:hypothetical protein
LFSLCDGVRQGQQLGSSVEEWHGWIFVDPSGAAGAFSGHVGELEDVVTRYGGETLRTAVTHTYHVASN